MRFTISSDKTSASVRQFFSLGYSKSRTVKKWSPRPVETVPSLPTKSLSWPLALPCPWPWPWPCPCPFPFPLFPLPWHMPFSWLSSNNNNNNNTGRQVRKTRDRIRVRGASYMLQSCLRSKSIICSKAATRSVGISLLVLTSSQRKNKARPSLTLRSPSNTESHWPIFPVCHIRAV